MFNYIQLPLHSAFRARWRGRGSLICLNAIQHELVQVTATAELPREVVQDLPLCVDSV